MLPLFPAPPSTQKSFSHLLPLHCHIVIHWGIKPSQEQEPLLPLMLDKAILCYHGSAGAMGPFMCVYSLVGGLALGCLVG